MNYDTREVPKPRRHGEQPTQPAWWTKIDLHSLRARLKSKDEKCGNRAANNESGRMARQFLECKDCNAISEVRVQPTLEH